MDNLEDELTLSALSLLVKDLLILFSAENEGVINVLGQFNILPLALSTNIIYRTLFRNVVQRCRASSRGLQILLRTNGAGS